MVVCLCNSYVVKYYCVVINYTNQWTGSPRNIGVPTGLFEKWSNVLCQLNMRLNDVLELEIIPIIMRADVLLLPHIFLQYLALN